MSRAVMRRVTRGMVSFLISPNWELAMCQSEQVGNIPTVCVTGQQTLTDPHHHCWHCPECPVHSPRAQESLVRFKAGIPAAAGGGRAPGGGRD